MNNYNLGFRLNNITHASPNPGYYSKIPYFDHPYAIFPDEVNIRTNPYIRNNYDPINRCERGDSSFVEWKSDYSTIIESGNLYHMINYLNSFREDFYFNFYFKSFLNFARKYLNFDYKDGNEPYDYTLFHNTNYVCINDRIAKLFDIYMYICLYNCHGLDNRKWNLRYKIVFSTDIMHHLFFSGGLDYYFVMGDTNCVNMYREYDCITYHKGKYTNHEGVELRNYDEFIKAKIIHKFYYTKVLPIMDYRKLFLENEETINKE